MERWKPYLTIDFSDIKFNHFSIDTRDFHCIPDENSYAEKLDLHKIKKYPERFFHTPESVVEILTGFFSNSGGEKTWRMLCLEGEGAKYSNGWEMKYLRIHRTEYGLVICNNNDFVLSRDILNCKVNKGFLGAQNI